MTSLPSKSPLVPCLVAALLLPSLVLQTGCTSYDTYPQQPAPTTRPAPSQPAPVVVKPQPGAVAPLPAPAPAVVLNPAALSLVQQARRQYRAQDYQGAIATAERGLRIDRRAADLYLLLAESYVQLGQSDKARLFVQQGQRFAPAGSETAQSLLRLAMLLGN